MRLLELLSMTGSKNGLWQDSLVVYKFGLLNFDFWPYNCRRMDIKWHGLSCFTIEGKAGTVVTDPFDSKVAGLALPKLSADIVVANREFELHHAVGSFGKETRIFDWPGEYEAKNIII